MREHQKPVYEGHLPVAADSGVRQSIKERAIRTTSLNQQEVGAVVVDARQRHSLPFPAAVERHGYIWYDGGLWSRRSQTASGR